MSYKIGFAGTDGRTLLSAFVISTATSEIHSATYQGVVVRGTPAMPAFSAQLKWPVTFIPTASNAVQDYSDAIIAALQKGAIDYVITRVVSGEAVGTLLTTNDEDKIIARKQWLAAHLRMSGTLIVDAGAAKAVVEGRPRDAGGALRSWRNRQAGTGGTVRHPCL